MEDTSRYDNQSDWLPLTTYIEMLMEVDESKCISLPPVRPQPGDIFFYHNKKKPSDWKSDQYRWRQSGKKRLPIQNPVVNCRYCKDHGNADWYKRIYNLIDRENSDFYLIHYVGSLEDVVVRPHGNRTKHNRTKPHVRTAPSVIEEQRKSAKGAQSATYRQMVSEGSAQIKPELLAVLTPRDCKQISNTISRKAPSTPVIKKNSEGIFETLIENAANSRSKATNVSLIIEDIDGISEMIKDLGGFVRLVALFPEFLCILWSDETMSHFKEISAQLADEEVTLYYDSSYKIEGYRLSMLFYRHPAFEGKPNIPLAFILHHSVNSFRVHNDFFLMIRSECAELDDKVIVIDNDPLIIAAFKLHLPKSRHVFCWDSIKGFVEDSLKSCDLDDLSGHRDMIFDLVTCSSLTEFESKIESMKNRNLTKNFALYDHVCHVIRTSGKLTLPDSSTSISMTECQKLVKGMERLFEDDDLLIDARNIIAHLYREDRYDYRNCVRSLCVGNKGDYKLRAGVAARDQSPSMFDYGTANELDANSVAQTLIDERKVKLCFNP